MKRFGTPAVGMSGGASVKPGALGVGTPPGARTTPRPPGATTAGRRGRRGPPWPPPRAAPPAAPAAAPAAAALAAPAGEAPPARAGGGLGLDAAARGLRRLRNGRA